MSKINKKDVLKVLVTELSAYILYLILYPLGEFLRSVDNVYISYFSIMLINIFLFYILDYAVGIILGLLIRSKKALLYWLGGFILLGMREPNPSRFLRAYFRQYCVNLARHTRVCLRSVSLS